MLGITGILVIHTLATIKTKCLKNYLEVKLQPIGLI